MKKAQHFWMAPYFKYLNDFTEVTSMKKSQSEDFGPVNNPRPPQKVLSSCDDATNSCPSKL